MTLPLKDVYHIAILGATGLVGQTILSILAERNFPVGKLSLLASQRSAGKTLVFQGKSHIVQDADLFDFTGVDIAFFSAGSDASARYAPETARCGVLVIDNTSQFRYDPDVPLVVPEVNPEALRDIPRGIISNPNCATIQLLVALKPIYDHAGIDEIHIATYQAVSGSGHKGVAALTAETHAIAQGAALPESNVYTTPIAENVLPQIDVFLENGYTKEEMKLIWETQKILADARIKIYPTAVRVPVIAGHSEAVHIRIRKSASIADIQSWLSAAPGVCLIDTQNTPPYPTAKTHAAGTDPVYVGRLRQSPHDPNIFGLWIVADNVRKGAALNAVQIAEMYLLVRYARSEFARASKGENRDSPP